MAIKDLTLNRYADKVVVKFTDLTYGSISGKAELIGYQIIAFKSNEKIDETCALQITDVDENETVFNIGNCILEDIKFPFKFKDSTRKVEEYYGTPLFVHNIYERINLNYYLVESNYLLCIGLQEKYGVCSVEIITNEKIIRERMETIKD